MEQLRTATKSVGKHWQMSTKFLVFQLPECVRGAASMEILRELATLVAMVSHGLIT